MSAQPEIHPRGTEPALVYGPVPSRRLGLSLGINLVIPKTCTFNCVYCQCGRTTCLTAFRKSFFPVEKIITAVNSALMKSKVDYLTLSGSGEPTLNRDIGELISILKKRFQIPVAVITNSSLLSSPVVRDALYQADLVIPTLACADEKTFRRVHRPHPKIRLKNIIRGLKTFRHRYHGRLWLEVMLVRGFNDQPEHLFRLRRIVHHIQPHRVHLNTVVRPPAEASALPVPYDHLLQLQMLFGPETDIIPPPVRKHQKQFQGNPNQAILAVVANRPVTGTDLALALGLPAETVAHTLEHLTAEGVVRKFKFKGKTFFTIRRV